jgi:heme/copper-type cytochrome/quinol oxidase subunit 2
MVKESVKNYGAVFAIAAFGIIADLSIIFTVFVCIIYFIVRYKNYKQKLNS